jgi:hypothetical protein
VLRTTGTEYFVDSEGLGCCFLGAAAFVFVVVTLVSISPFLSCFNGKTTVHDMAIVEAAGE